MISPSSDPYAASADPQQLALQGLDMPRLYFVGDAPTELRPSLDGVQAGLVIYSVFQCDYPIFRKFVHDCARTALVPLDFSGAEQRAWKEVAASRRAALRRLLTAGALVPVYSHVGTAQAAIQTVAQAKHRALRAEAEQVEALMSEATP